MLIQIFNFFQDEYINLFIFCLNIFFLIVFITSLFYIKKTKTRWNKFNNYIVNVTRTVDSVRYGNLTKKIDSLDFPDSENLTESLNRMIETLHDREKMIDEFQKDLINQNNILEKTLNSLSDGLLIIDENYNIHRATKIVTSWFHTDGKNIIDRPLKNFIEIPSKKPLLLLNNDEIVIPTQNDYNFALNIVELNIDNEKDRYLVIIKNITAQKELETLKDDFVATLTHDLKVPIIAETNMLDLFLNEKFGKISEKQELALKNMQASNKELLDLVQVVLETYKLRDNKMKLYKENITLESFINEIIKEMQPIAKKTNNELKFILDRDICVYADRFQLKRVIKNLIQNAISYGKAKTPISITIGEIPDYTIIKVKDLGDGISREQIDKIFNRYYSAAKKFRKIGTGLGLYLSQQIMKAHEGELLVDSKEGEYTEFCIKIPVNYERHSLPY